MGLEKHVGDPMYDVAPIQDEAILACQAVLFAGIITYFLGMEKGPFFVTAGGSFGGAYILRFLLPENKALLSHSKTCSIGLGTTLGISIGQYLVHF